MEIKKDKEKEIKKSKEKRRKKGRKKEKWNAEKWRGNKRFGDGTEISKKGKERILEDKNQEGRTETSKRIIKLVQM